MNIETKEGLFALMEQIAEEREAARPIVERLVTSGEPIEDIEIPEGWRTAGFAVELTSLAESIDEANHNRSLALQRLALCVASDLSRQYPSPVEAFVTGVIWNQIAWQHIYAAALQAAIRATKSAREILETEHTTSSQIGVAHLREATALVFGRRYDQSIAPIAKAAEVIFRELGDRHHLYVLDHIKANLHHYRGEFELACAKYQQLLAQADPTDLRTIADLSNNLGIVYRALGRFADAVATIQKARAINLDLGRPVYRQDWSLASVLLIKSEYDKAIPILVRLRKDFLTHELAEEAGLVGLDIVDGLIGLNRLEEARALTEQILGEFREAKLHDDAIRALGYLRDLVTPNEQLQRAVRQVRSRVERLGSDSCLHYLSLDDVEEP